MVIPKEILTDYKEVYEKASKLINEESKNDPSTDPYRSHYAARELLLDMYENLRNSINSVKAELGDKVSIDQQDLQNDLFIYEVILAFICRDLGRIYIFTDEISSGQAKLEESIKLIESHKLQPEAIIPYIGAVSELGIVFSNRDEHSKAYETLQMAEDSYVQFKESRKEALSLTDIFGTREEIEKGKGQAELEKLYTLCIFYMAQVCGHLGQMEKSATYCHKTLHRQLTDKSYEPIDFALNAATLSQYFITRHLFKEARHHLAAATFIMKEYEGSMITADMTQQQIEDAQDTFKHRFADVARCWVKYGLCLLSSSKERLMCDDETKLAMDVTNMSFKEDFSFPTLDLKSLEKRVPAEFCLTFQDAKRVYHFVTGWIEKALEYYKIDTEASEHAKIIKDYAELYEHIAFFEEDPVNQMKMQKRRAKYFDDLQEQLNPIFYMAICRECWYGAGSAYCSMLDIKLDMLKGIQTPDAADLIKINQICNRAIKSFETFINSYKDQNTEKLKPNIDVEEQRTILYAYFYLGRLHFKKITPNPHIQLENLVNSLEYYKTFVKECEERPEASAHLQGEIGVSKEMVNLLPLKIASFQSRLKA